MTFIIAVAGKGGVGKTTVTGLIVKYLKESEKEPILAIDADPNSNLYEKLGMDPPVTIGSVREELATDAGKERSGVSKSDIIGYKIRTIVSEGSGFDLLAMGRPEGPGCYCFINNLLRASVDALAEKYPYMVIDNEAGMEHLSRRTARNVDILLIVSDATPTGLRTAVRLATLASEMNLNRVKTVMLVNRARPGDTVASISDKVKQICKLPQIIAPHLFDEIYMMPEDAELNAYNSECKSLIAMPAGAQAYNECMKIMGRMLK
jgi:CO dehydrogenase maturation factor